MLAIEIPIQDGEMTHIRAPIGASICGKTEPGLVFSPGRWDPATCPECKELRTQIHAINLKGKKVCRPKEMPSFYTSTIHPEDVTCHVCIRRLNRGYKIQPRRVPVAQLTPEPRPNKLEVDGRNPLSPSQVRAICLLYEHGFAVGNIATAYATSRETIYEIVRGKKYKYVARPIYSTGA